MTRNENPQPHFVILLKGYCHWLSTLDPDPRGLLVPFSAAAMKMWPISTRVNKAENNDEAILEPIEAQEEHSLL